MWPTWNTVRTWWHHVMLLVLVAVVLCVSACTTPGRSSSTPAALSPEGGLTGPMIQGDGNGGM
jgi:hypothetical protein